MFTTIPQLCALQIQVVLLWHEQQIYTAECR